MPSICHYSNPGEKTKPYETCLYCAQKHLASALSMSVFDLTGRNSILLRIASQVQLAAFHFGTKYPNEYEKCIFIVNEILSLKEYKNDLTNLTEISWEKLSSEVMKDVEFHEELLLKTEKSFKFGCLHVSNAIEMLKFEADYKHINYSYAIGQLVLANWVFQNFDKSLADECRELYHDVEMETINIENIETFRNKIWNIYLNKYI